MEPFSGATGITQLTEGNEMSILIWEARMLGLYSGEGRNGRKETEDAYAPPHSSPYWFNSPLELNEPCKYTLIKYIAVKLQQSPLLFILSYYYYLGELSTIQYHTCVP